MTLEAWVNPSAVNANWRDVVYKGNDNFYLEATSSERLAAGCGHDRRRQLRRCLRDGRAPRQRLVAPDRDLRRRSPPPLRQRHQVASTAHTGTIASSTNPLQIGGDSIYGQFFAGLIDEVRVYNVALTPAQIQTDQATPVNNGPDTQPPTQPGTLTANAVSGGEIDLAWGASSDNVGVSGYQLERCQGSGCSNFAQIATPTGTSYKDTGLSPSTSYSYRVRASDGTNLSSYSNIAGATTPTPDTQPPTQPGTLTANAVSGSEIDLAWGASSDNVGVSGYQLERCQGSGCSNFAQIATPTGTSYKDTGLSPSTSYSYRVRASDGTNLSTYSNIAAPPPRRRHAAAVAPGTLTATAVSASEIDLPGAPRPTTSASPATSSSAARARLHELRADRAPTGTSHSDTGLGASTSYSYRVRASDGTNLSSYSNIAGATTPRRPTDWSRLTASTRARGRRSRTRPGTATRARSRRRPGRRPASTARRCSSTARARSSRSPTRPHCTSRAG